MNRCFVALVALVAAVTPSVAEAKQAPMLVAPTVAAKVAPDPKALALLKKVQAKMLAAKSLSAVVEHTNLTVSGTENIRFVTTTRMMKPNYFRSVVRSYEPDKSYDGWAEDGKAMQFASDGENNWELYGRTYRTKSAAQLNRLVYDVAAFDLPLTGFFTTDQSLSREAAQLKTKGELSALRYAGKETWNGAPYDVIVMEQASAYQNTPYKSSRRIYIGGDGFIHRIREKRTMGTASEVTAETVVKKLVVGAPMKPATFAFTPPKDFKSEAEVEAKRPKLLTAGTPAPDFSVVNKDGKTVKLSDYRGKVVVLDFWATWCGPCMASLPHTAEVAQKMADRGVVTLAVNVWDKKDAFDAWLPTNEKKYDGITFVLDPSPGGQAIATPLYHVSGIPTQYIIDRDGKIRQSFVGFGGPTKALENAIAAADKPMITAPKTVAKKEGR